MRTATWIALVVASGCIACKKATPAPVYGSTPALSTLRGFVIGTWKLGRDDTKAKSKEVSTMINTLRLPSPILAFKPDGKYVYHFGYYDALGTWSCDERGVNLVLETVGGRPIEQVQREYDTWRSYVHSWGDVDIRARLHRDWQRRGTTLQSASRCTRLELYNYNRELYMPGPYIHEDGSSIFGILVWRRQ